MQTNLNVFSKYYGRKAHSKRGFTLVEAVCSIIIFAIVCVGVLNAVAFSREMVYSNNAREKASDKAQLIADEIVAAATGEDPEGAGNPEDNITNRVNQIVNNGPTSSNIQTDVIGKVVKRSESAGFKTPDNDDECIQYIIKKVTDGTDVSSDITVVVSRPSGLTTEHATIHQTKISGWDIKVRVYYKAVGSGEWRVVEVSAFAPKDDVSVL